MKRKISLTPTNIFIAIALSILLFGLGYQFGQYSSRNSVPSNITTSSNSQSRNIDFTLFWNVWNKLEEKYVDKKKLNTQKMFYGAIKGMVASVEDPYTFFLSPDENKDSKNDLGGCSTALELNLA